VYNNNRARRPTLTINKMKKRPRPDSSLPRDLSELSSPSDAAPAPLDAAGLRALALSSEDIAKFDRDGFCATQQPVLTPSQLESLRSDLDALTDEQRRHPKIDLLHEIHFNEAAGSGQVLFHCLGHWRIARSFHDLAFQDGITLPACQVRGSPLQLEPAGCAALFCASDHQLSRLRSLASAASSWVAAPSASGTTKPSSSPLATEHACSGTRTSAIGTAPVRWRT
jgi:hypothetical protein